MEINELYFGYQPFSKYDKSLFLTEADESANNTEKQPDEKGGDDQNQPMTIWKFLLNVMNSSIPEDQREEVEKEQREEVANEKPDGALDDGSDSDSAETQGQESKPVDEISKLLQETYDKMQKEIAAAGGTAENGTSSEVIVKAADSVKSVGDSATQTAAANKGGKPIQPSPENAQQTQAAQPQPAAQPQQPQQPQQAEPSLTSQDIAAQQKMAANLV